MTFIVKWYGDQPVDAAWYLARSHGLWLAFLVGAVLLGAVAPIVGCAWERVRGSPSALRAVGVSAIVGIGLHDLWLAGPGAPDLAIVTAPARRRRDGRRVRSDLRPISIAGCRAGRRR